MTLDLDKRRLLRMQVTFALFANASVLVALISNIMGFDLITDVTLVVWATYTLVFIFGRVSDLRAMDLVDGDRLHDDN